MKDRRLTIDDKPASHSSLEQGLHAFKGSDVVGRFPVALAFSVLFTLNMLLVVNKVAIFSDDIKKALAFFFGAGFFWSVHGVLWTESRGYDNKIGWKILGAGLLLLAGLIFFAPFFAANVFLLTAALIVFTATAAYTQKQADNAAYWLFNHNLWLAAGFAVVVALLLMAGIAMIISTFKYLFGVHIRDFGWAFFNVISVGLVAPVFWLSLIGKDFTQQVSQGGVYDFTSGAVASIIKYIFVPLLLFYTLILYGYSLKILWTLSLPKGQLGWMVLAYGAVGTLAATMAWPSRKTGGKLVSFFWNYWFGLLLLPVLLLFLAAYQRIAQYGLTFDRYNLVAAGIWFVVISLYFIWKQEKADLRMIPGLLAVFFLFSSFGFWGATGLSNYSQGKQLEAYLIEKKMLKNGKLVENSRKIVTLTKQEKNRIYSIIDYLDQHNGLDQIKGWFGNLKTHPWYLKRMTHHGYRRRGRQSRPRAERRADGVLVTDAASIDFAASDDTVISLKGYSHMSMVSLSYDHTNRAIGIKGVDYQEDLGFQNGLFLNVKNNKLHFRDKAGNKVVFDLLKLVQDLKNKERATASPIWLEQEVGTLKLAIAFKQLSAVLSFDEQRIKFLFRANLMIFMNEVSVE